MDINQVMLRWKEAAIQAQKVLGQAIERANTAVKELAAALGSLPKEVTFGTETYLVWEDDFGNTLVEQVK